MINFDTSLYEPPVPAVIVDVFSKRIGEGLSAGISEAQLPDWQRAAQARHEKGEHCPLVIGHTIDGAAEVNQPPKVGWITGPYTVEGKAIVGQHWIRKEVTVPLNGVPMKLSAKELVDAYPRRSAELWFRDRKIDPVAMLGATTPEREMGLIRLAHDSGAVVSHELPRLRLSKSEPVTETATKKDDKTLPDVDSAKFKQFEALQMHQQQQIDAMAEMIGQMQAALQSMQPQGGMTDDELEKLLNAHMGGDGSGTGPQPQPAPDKPVKNQLSPEAVELAEARLKLSRISVEQKLSAVEAAGTVLPFADGEKRETFVTDLLAMPPEMQDRMIETIKLSRTAPAPTSGFAAALANSVAVANGEKRVTKADMPAVMKLARDKGIEFTAAAKELGFTVAQ